MAHINPYVVVWTILSVIGVAFSLVWLIETRDDEDDLRRSEAISGVLDDDLTIVSRAAVRNAVGRLLVKALFLAIGVESLAAEMGALFPLFPDIFSWEFIIAILTLTFLSYMDRLERRDLHRALSQRQEEKIAIAQVAELTAQTHQETLAAIKENTDITKQADEHATAAVHEANIAVEAHSAQLDAIATTDQDTNERTQDVQEKAGTLVDLVTKNGTEPPKP